MIELMNSVDKLKRLKRSGWVEKNIKNPESVADHSFGVIMLASTIDLPERIDRNKLIKMALIHDIGESQIGDIIWEKGNKPDLKIKNEKEIKELKAIKNIVKDSELKELGIEYIEQKTPLALFLKELDKLEMAFQALFYEKEGHNLQEFWDNVEKHLKNEETIKIFEEIKKIKINS